MLTAENKNELDGLLASHEMTSHLLSPTVSDAGNGCSDSAGWQR